ncbi:MAG TPA: hypothetical protein VN922_21610 [Bacteroidia bacterium]|nr:hypothetical protein [Bacteroidia bacterium]
MKNSKKVVRLFVTCIVFISCYGHAQNNVAGQEVIDTLRKFYTDYTKEWSTDTGFTLKRKIYSLRKKICTSKLLKPMADNLDYDPLINNYATDIVHLNTLIVIKDSAKANTYIISYDAPGLLKPNIIHVKVVKEKGIYKIDSAW